MEGSILGGMSAIRNWENYQSNPPAYPTSVILGGGEAEVEGSAVHSPFIRKKRVMISHSSSLYHR
jgi:hypothetical protein